MDLVLVTVTLVSLSIAVAMGIVTFRALRLERSPAGDGEGEVRTRTDAVPLIASGSDVSAAGREKRAGELDNAGEARDATIHATLLPQRKHAGSRRSSDPARDAADHATLVAERHRGGGATDPVDTGRRLVLAFGIGAVAIMVVGSSVITLNHRAARARQAADAMTALELISLDQAREGGQLAIRGVVRNPAEGDALNGVSAVVLLFDRKDTFLGAREQAVAKAELPPGTESPFEVVLPDGGRASRYRVSFRSGTQALPHLDRRGPVRAAPAKARAAHSGLMTVRLRVPSR